MSYLHAIQILDEEKFRIERLKREMGRIKDECGIEWLNGKTESLWHSDICNALTALKDLQDRLKRGEP